jgi:hypothetical protein
VITKGLHEIPPHMSLTKGGVRIRAGCGCQAESQTDNKYLCAGN